MQCKIDGCGRDARYKSACMCQKHYFRQWRYGTTDSARKPARERFTRDDGYVYVYDRCHPLMVNNGYVAEHRKALYDVIGPAPMQCAMCGVSLTWASCHVDHIDEVKSNNHPGNLRPTCLACNTGRSRSKSPRHSSKNAHAINYLGETKTPSEWERDPRVQVSRVTIIRRKAAGMSDEQALFADKKTHNGKGKRIFVV